MGMGKGVLAETPIKNHVAAVLATVYAVEWSKEVQEALFAPAGMGIGLSLEEAIGLFGPFLPDAALPLSLVDEESIAVVAMEPLFPGHLVGFVYRYHLRDVGWEHQFALLDIDPLLYASSVEEEVLARPEGLRRILDEIGPAYRESHVLNDKRPRDFIVRPIRPCLPERCHRSRGDRSRLRLRRSFCRRLADVRGASSSHPRGEPGARGVDALRCVQERRHDGDPV